MTGFLLGGSLAPIGLTASFLRRPLENVLAGLETWRTGLGHSLERSDARHFPECAGVLDPFEAPWTTELLVDCGEWTAYTNNFVGGGDPTAAAPYLGRLLETTCVVACHFPKHPPGHAQTSFSLNGPSGAAPLRGIRNLTAHCEDGRWSWHEWGTPQSFEQPDRYRARRIRDRLDRPLLVTYLAAMGIHVDDPAFFGEGIAVRQIVKYPVRRQTVAETKAAFGW